MMVFYLPLPNKRAGQRIIPSYPLTPPTHVGVAASIRRPNASPSDNLTLIHRV